MFSQLNDVNIYYPNLDSKSVREVDIVFWNVYKTSSYRHVCFSGVDANKTLIEKLKRIEAISRTSNWPRRCGDWPKNNIFNYKPFPTSELSRPLKSPSYCTRRFVCAARSLAIKCENFTKCNRFLMIPLSVVNFIKNSIRWQTLSS